MAFKMPPNWGHHTHVTLGKQLTYHSIPVSSKSDEYSVISSLLEPVNIDSVEQVVNPTLWDKFKQRRTEMLKCKSTDEKVLSALGLNEVEVREALAYSKNFTPHEVVAHIPFDLNMSLLFHCTGSLENIESILTEGLDERLGNLGYLGRGIYFADNPKKSMTYDRCSTILIFAVLLGDCLSMDKEQNRSLIREPKKELDQKRHSNDLFFDSIVGRPGGDDNEFVIYNRYQCLPLYRVKYTKLPSMSGGPPRGESVQAKKDFPEFCWESTGQYEHPMPSVRRLQNNSWPFDANKLFEKMGVRDS